eukprot:1190731-Prorocentrum_minimum.AAC.3
MRPKLIRTRTAWAYQVSLSADKIARARHAVFLNQQNRLFHREESSKSISERSATPFGRPAMTKIPRDHSKATRIGRAPEGPPTVMLHFHKAGGTTLCSLAKLQPSVRLSERQRRHNCNAPHEGPHSKDEWWHPDLVTCDDLRSFFREHK